MKNRQLASRYAKALFFLANESGKSESVLAELRGLEEAFAKEPAIQEYFATPLVRPEQREEALLKAVASKVSSEIRDFLLLLATRNRLSLFSEIVQAYEQQNDAAHGVTRGTVESAIALRPEERKGLEATVKKVIKKEVILSYKTNPKIIGGLLAKVGSYTFDDSIQSHLRRMNEDLKRRTV